MKITRVLVALGLTFTLSACVSEKFYTPNPDTNQLEEIIEFTATGDISLINNQPDTEEHLYHPQSKYHANYNAWTDVAIAIIERELAARGFNVTDDAGKSLSLSINHVATETGWTQIQSQVHMSVETGGGYSGEYVGRNHSVMAANLKRQADGAVMRVVVAMLNDPEIITYLTE